MEWVNVTTQAELDQAIANGNIPVCIGKGYFVASGDATVEAWGDATVEAWGDATVEAWGDATVRAWGAATVEASGAATVEAWGAATVEAWGAATVRAWGDATVEASGAATVRASKYVAVHRYGTTPKVTGGVLIQIPDLTDTANFFDFYGVEIKKGKAIVYKLLDANFVSGHGTTYQPGTSATCPDWNPRAECGGGLHFSPRPFMAHKYSNGTRFVACEIEVDGAVVINDWGSKPDKLKAKSCKVLYECDADGEKI